MHASCGANPTAKGALFARLTGMATATPTQKSDRQTAAAVSKDNQPDNPLVEHLRRQAANAIVLYGNYKHYHWQVYGPQFRDLHKLFDELAHEVLHTIDELAERVRMIGQDPPAHILEAADIATVPVAAPQSDVREMIEEADRNLLVVIAEMRQGARLADEHDDPGTVDIYSKTVQVHEKHEWWMRDLLRRGDGLNS
jgi:starvation-inducible DNA-binding protein